MLILYPCFFQGFSTNTGRKLKKQNRKILGLGVLEIFKSDSNYQRSTEKSVMANRVAITLFSDTGM